MTRRTKCMNCGGSGLHSVMDLGLQPNGNRFVFADEIETELKFPLEMLVCSECWQVQIAEFPPAALLFDDHPYVTGVNKPVVDHFRRLAPHAIAFAALKKGDLVLDLGCNDGTLLDAFADAGMCTMGIDPSRRVVELARAKRHVVGRTYFGANVGGALQTLGLRPRLITATAVFYHVPDLHDFIAGIEAILDDHGIFLVQGVNLQHLVENLQFDHFYHEHSCIHSIGALNRLFNSHDMRLLDVEFYPVHGGSFVAFVGRSDNPVKTSPRVAEAISSERAAGLMSLDRYQRFATDVLRNMEALKSLLMKLRAEGKTVFGLGAPVKGSTLLNFCGIGPELVSCLTEVNGFKIGRLSPGTHIPVVGEETLERQPDYYLVLSWNFADYLADKYRSYLAAGGRFILPVPTLRVVGG